MPGASSTSTGRGCRAMKMSRASKGQMSLLSILSQEDFLAPTSAWLDEVKAWLGRRADCSTSSCVSLMSLLPVGFCSKTSLAFCATTAEEISLPFSPASPGRGRKSQPAAGETPAAATGHSGALPGAFLTLSVSEVARCTATNEDGGQCPNDAGGSSLLRILWELEVPSKFFLSQKAAAGMLRRTAERGREPPPDLKAALEAIVKASE